MSRFTHLHLHTQYSILDGFANINKVVAKAKLDGMSAVAITDHGYMFGVKEFYNACKGADIKPLLGVETYVAQRSIYKKENQQDRSGRHLILIAKNKVGYKNLLALCSKAATEGVYYRPRIDKDLLTKHHEGLIVCSACLGGEIPKLIDAGNIEGAKESIMWFKNLFGDDYYLELQRHRSNDPKLRTEITLRQDRVNEEILKLSKECGVKVIASNDVHFVDADDAEAHDLLICGSTGADYDDENRLHYTQQEWMKTHDEMSELFIDIPEAISNTFEIAEKVEEFELNSSAIMPIFPIPKEFGTEEEYRKKFNEDQLREELGNGGYELAGSYEKALRTKLEADYLDYITRLGAEMRYGKDRSPSLEERIDFELNVIKRMGFPAYFLIVQDFIRQARKMDVIVGPGRGSAAGSVVAYCIEITNIDPIRHDLLFERFLNPDRISMPDVDIDFDDDGREKVLHWVREKYGFQNVAHVCTFGSLAAKSAIKDVARAFKLPLSESNRISKLVPDGISSFAKAFKASPELEAERNSSNPLIAKIIRLAMALEGSIRQTGVHPCGILICKDPLQEHIPLMAAKDTDGMFATQYDGNFVESIGLLKMDFLGLRTLSILKEVIENVRLSKNILIDIDDIPDDDPLTYKLFGEGETVAIFQFESPGMRKHLKSLNPKSFDSLVAMNALYRPGPLKYIPDFIRRSNGEETVEYDHPILESALKSTFGITVYQEQVMLISRELANFTRGESDVLRKAMGKKKKDAMNGLWEQFSNGCMNNPEFIRLLPEKYKTEPKALIKKIWDDWLDFASYAFNKSHSVSYAYLSYIMAYLKANYPAEFMAGVLSRNLSDIKKISEFMDECKRMNLEVKGPDVNESFRKFTANSKGVIRFGMGGIKGLGEAAVDCIIEERDKRGPFSSIYDFAERINLRVLNKKGWEVLAISGAFDSIGSISRSQYFGEEGNGLSFIETLIRYGNYVQDDNKGSGSLFDGLDDAPAIKKPEPPKENTWHKLEELEKEKEVIGIYLSGHPLDDYSLILENFCNISMAELNKLEPERMGTSFDSAGIVSGIKTALTKKGDHYGVLTIEDFSGTKDFYLFNKDFVDYNKFFFVGFPLFIHGEFVEKYQKYQKFQDKAAADKPREMEIKINSIKHLSEVKNTLFKKVALFLAEDNFDENIVEDICTVFEEHKVVHKKENKKDKKKDLQGCPVYIYILNEEGRAPIELRANAGRIHVTKKMIKDFNSIKGVLAKIK